MRTTHKLTLTSARAILAAVALFAVAGLVFAFAPMRPVAAARQALASRVSASPVTEKILSLAPASVRRAVKKQAAPAAPAKSNEAAGANMAMGANMMFAAAVAKDAVPPSGSAVYAGETIVYTITVANDGSSKGTIVNGFLRVTDTAPAGTLFQNASVIKQPGGTSTAWSCSITGGGTTLACRAGDDTGAGVENLDFNQTLQIRVEAVVQNNVPNGTILSNTATFSWFNGVATSETDSSNTTSHLVAGAADLSIAKFSNAGGGGGSNVIAGGTSAAYTTPGVVSPGPGTGNIDYQLLIGNGGPANGSSVIIQDAFPSNTVLVSSPALDPATIAINGTPQPTFAITCNVFSGNFIECRPGNNTAINPAYTPDVLPAGFSARLNYRVRVPSNVAQGTIIQNQARISSQQTNPGPALLTVDPNAGNNTSTPVNTNVIAQTDLGITKMTGNSTPVAGGAAFAYTLVVTNNGPSDANNIVVTDPLPPGIVLANNNIAVVNNPSVPGYGLVCTGPANGSNGTVTCTGSLPGGPGGTSTSTITIVVQADANLAGGVRTNTATVTSSTQEVSPNVLPNTASVAVTIANNASLSITKTAPSTACAGDNLTYNISVTNAGSSSAVNVVVTDVLPLPANPPPGFTPFVSVAGTGAFANNCSYNANTNTLTCTAGFLPTGTSNINLVVRTSPGTATGALTNSATLSAAVGTITGTNPATATTTITHCSDLEITKDGTPDAVLAGQDINYTITVKNIGPSDLAAGQYVVNDTTFPPAGTALKTGTVVNAPGFSCNGTTSAATCTGTSPLPAGSSTQIKFTVTVNANFNGGQPGGSVVNTATVAVISTAQNPVVDANSANNASTSTTPVGPSADLSIQKASYTLLGSAFDAQVTAGGAISAAPPSLPVPIVTGQGEIFYALTYRNSGLGDAVNVHIRDVIPANTQFVAGSIVVTPAAGPALTCTVSPLPTQLDCTPTGGGTLPAGANGTITFRTRVLANVADGTAIKNTATINSEGIGATPATPDPNGGNNLSNETQNRVRTEANLAITKTGPASVNAGANITYTITVTNNGVSDAQNVVVKDTLPANVSFVSATSTNNQFVCTPDNGNAGVVNCTSATLIANDPNIIPPRSGSNTATITLVGKVASSVANGTVLANNATVSSTTSDPVTGNNSVGPVNTTVTTDSAVTIVKTDNPDPVVAGTNLTYTITVANNGPSDAQAVSVVDTLPPTTQVQFLSAVGTGVFSAANSCTVNLATNVVTCNAVPGGVFPAGATANITIVVKVLPSVPANALPQNPDDPAGLLNTATINWQDSNGVVGGLIAQSATDTERTTVRHESDMAILKEAPDFVLAGTRLDYRLTISNLGPSDVLGDNAPQGALGNGTGSIIVRDVLPAGTSLANIPNNPFVAPGGPGNFTCTYTAATREVLCRNAAGAAGNFFAGAKLDIIIKVDVDSNVADGSNLVNCATVTLRNTNPTPEIDPLGGGQHNDADVVTTAASGNNQSCDTTLVRTSADLSASKTATPVVDPDGAGPLAPVALPVVGPNVPAGSVNAGGYIRYDVPFGNAGPSDALNVLLNDQLPGNTAFVGALATGGVFVPATQPPANPFTFTIQAVDTVAPLGPNVNLTCTVQGNPGSQAIYCRPQGNTGLGAPGPYADGTLPAGYSGTLTYFVQVNQSVSGGTIVSNPANITSGLCPNGTPPPFPPVTCASTSDPNTSNNTTLPTQTVVVASSNLAITKIVQSAVTAASNPNQTGPVGPATAQNGTATTGTAVLPGTQLTYRITVFNNGPSDVSNIRVTDVLPSGLESPPGRVLGAKFVSASPVLGSGATFTCAPPTGVSPVNNPQSNGGNVVCTAPLLAAVDDPNTSVTENRASIDITVFIDPATKQNLVDVATFDATVNNFNRPVSGSTTLTTPVAPTSDLALTKTHTNAAGVVGGPVTAGTTFTYTITATNNGPSTGQMFNLVDTFPAFQKVTKIEIGRLDGNGQFVTPNAKDGNGNPNVTCTTVPALGSPGNTTSMTCTASELPPNKNSDGTVNPAGTIVFRLTVDQDPLTIQPTPVNYQNCVSATSMSTDPVAANSTNVCDTVPIIFLANPTGTKVATPNPVIAGNLLTYTITATNPGPSAALNFRIIDPLPTGTVFISAVASAGATLTTPAVGANGTVTARWDAAGGTPNGLTAPGVTRTLTIVVRVCPDFQQILNLTDAQMCVPNLTDTATITSDTPGTPATASFTSTVQAQSDLSISKSAPAQAIYSTTGSPSTITYTITFANAGPSNANGVTITDVLPKGFTVAPGANSLTSTVPGTTFTTTSTDGITTVVANLGVIGAANQCQLTRPTSGTITIVALIPIKHPSISVTNQATIASTNCLPETGTLAVLNNPNSGYPPNITPGTGMLANNRAFASTNIVPPQTTPGNAYPALSEVSDQKEGSILFYPIYTSDATNANTQNTRVAITNTSNTEKVTVHLFAVDGSSCAVLDAFICLTPNQTSVFLASDFDPGNTGYLMAVAVEDKTGLPRVFNELIGDEYVKFTTGHAANLGAEAIAASMMFPGGIDPNVTTTTLRFDGMFYNRLPRVVASDNIPSPADGNSTMLIIDRVGGNFTTTGANIGNITGQLFDDSEQAFSFTANLGLCQYRTILNNTFPRTFTPFNRILPSGRSGWMKFWRVDDGALLGSQINFNANAGTSSNAFNRGHNLHALTLSDATTIVVPVFIPNC